MAHRRVLRRGVVLGDDHHGGGETQTDERRPPQRHHAVATVGHHDAGDRVEGDGGEHAGDDEATIEGVHDLAALPRLHEEHADDGGDDGHAAQHQRIQHRVLTGAGHHQAAQQHGGEDGHRVGFEQVGGHAGAVAHVVAHVIGNDRGVARVVLGDAGLHLAHQVGAHVRALGEDAAAQSREDGDQRAAEPEAHQGVQDIGKALAFRGGGLQIGVIAGHAQQTQADHQQAGDGAAAERDLQRIVQAAACRLGGTHVGAHRDVHADVAREAGEHGTDEEADRRLPVERQAKHDEQHHADHADGGVLAVEIGLSAFLNRRGDRPHALRPCRSGQNPLHRDTAENQRGDSASQGE